MGCAVGGQDERRESRFPGAAGPPALFDRRIRIMQAYRSSPSVYRSTGYASSRIIACSPCRPTSRAALGHTVADLQGPLEARVQARTDDCGYGARPAAVRRGSSATVAHDGRSGAGLRDPGRTWTGPIAGSAAPAGCGASGTDSASAAARTSLSVLARSDLSRSRTSAVGRSGDPVLGRTIDATNGVS